MNDLVFPDEIFYHSPGANNGITALTETQLYWSNMSQGAKFSTYIIESLMIPG